MVIRSSLIVATGSVIINIDIISCDSYYDSANGHGPFAFGSGRLEYMHTKVQSHWILVVISVLL